MNNKTSHKSKFSGASKILKTCRWLIYPFFFMIIIWTITSKPDIFLNKLPPILSSNLDKVTFKNLIPIYPKSLLKSWEVSRLEYELTLLENHIPKNQTQIDYIMNKIGNILEKPDITIKEIHSIYNNLIQVQHERSLSQRVTGLFTFVNLIWLLAIFGITVSVGPCIYVILEPLRTGFIKIGIFIYNKIVINFHIWGIWELLAYIICSLLVIEGLRFNKEVGFYISLTGLFLTIPAYIYSWGLHCPIELNENVMIFNVMWINLYYLPISIIYNSSFLAWIFVISLFNCLGFSLICSGLCYYIGFDDRDKLYRCSVSSIILQIIFISMKIIGINSDIISLYQSPFITFGSVILHLALLIISSKYYVSSKNYMYRQILMICLLIVSLFFGSVWNLNGLYNTASTFALLYILEKYVEIHLECRWNGWILVFIISISTYYLALFLHRHPNFIISLFEYY